MENAIREFATQFSFEPRIENIQKLADVTRFVVGGMGGSHLAADILAAARPDIDLSVHRSYGLPAISPADAKNTLFIASSYSGNTEETLDFASEAFAAGYPIAAIAVGGKLLEWAKEKEIPYILLPDTGVQPRSALGLSVIALAAFIRNELLISELMLLTSALKPGLHEEEGTTVAEAFRGKIPVIYASAANEPVAYNWKIKMNETGKIPAFYNIIPEMNHNELAGMDILPSTKSLSAGLHFIFITDSADKPQIQKRMQITKQLYRERGLSTSYASLSGASRFERIFNSLLIADWAALTTARGYGAEPEQVKIIEQFKALITH